MTSTRGEVLNVSISLPTRQRRRAADRCPIEPSPSFVDVLPFGVIVTDPNGAALRANRTWVELTGQSARDWRGSGWLEAFDVNHRRIERDELVDSVRSTGRYDGDWAMADGPDVRKVLHVRAVAEVRDAHLRHIVVVTADVTAERAHVDRLVEQATRDALTGLFNRQRFLDDVGAALERRRHRARGVVAVLFIDVDDLKSTNDRFGHDSGDRLLREVATRIVAAVRPADIVARYGGDEFTVLCEELQDFAEAAEIADRIVDRVYRCGNGDQPHSISIGVAVAEDPGVDPVRIVADADQAMYRVKRWNQPDADTLPNGISPSTGRR